MSAVLLLGLSGCGLSPSTSAVPEVRPGAVAAIDHAGDRKVTVTSKNFTEQIILGKMAVLTAKAVGFDVTDMTNVPGSVPSRNMMVGGEAQIGWEYIGTAWLTYMGHEKALPDAERQWQAVKDEDAANGLDWGRPSAVNNTYAFAVNQEVARKYGLKTMDDIRTKVPVRERQFCVESEFNSRQDGMNPFLETYGIPRGSAEGVPDGNVSIMDTGSIYAATGSGDCTFGEVFTTDGRIPALDLVVLQDTRRFFPQYNASPVFNAQLVKDYPELPERFQMVSERLNDDTMRSLNYQVDVEGKDPGDVAEQWMVDQGLIKEG
ncbi:glycine betaine ABC transporter substrate-binding protein [Rothia kristinae]|uniref:glycine betaine ABC transporter substrate-binding protein n=1 Tax=Rothia kristinae TaxID=37923 RepID=UPI001E3FE27C|nr:glycine betaine ABC transporter substrate-binding protein [Rothia kristinae]MDN5640299.1 glycine betaine ABC transporter substrate-binding protein [Actinomycetes bacterium]